MGSWRRSIPWVILALCLAVWTGWVGGSDINLSLEASSSPSTGLKWVCGRSGRGLLALPMTVSLLIFKIPLGVFVGPVAQFGCCVAIVWCLRRVVTSAPGPPTEETGSPNE